MSSIYRFSPITTQKEFEKALNYLTENLDKLSNKLLNKSLPITTLKIFPHYQNEYDYLYKHISTLGPKASFSSKTSYYVEVNKQIQGHKVNYLGIRIVDPYRLHVGCGDYEIDDFADFRNKIIIINVLLCSGIGLEIGYFVWKIYKRKQKNEKKEEIKKSED